MENYLSGVFMTEKEVDKIYKWIEAKGIDFYYQPQGGVYLDGTVNDLKLIGLIQLIHDYNEEHTAKKVKPTNKFVKPTLEEVQAYCLERKNGIDPASFIDSNEAKGWVVGKTRTPMKDWKAAIRTWENMRKQDCEYTPITGIGIDPVAMDNGIEKTPWEKLIIHALNDREKVTMFMERCKLWSRVLYGIEWLNADDFFHVEKIAEYERIYNEMAKIGAGRTMKECADEVVLYMTNEIHKIDSEVVGGISDTEGF
jgi:hypothetical protein